MNFVGFVKRFLRSPSGLLVCLLAVNLCIGLYTFRSYGESVDEAGIYVYANQSYQAYSHFFEAGYVVNTSELDPDLKYYGPAFVLLARFFVVFMNLVFPSVGTDFWHLSYFLAFQVSIGCIYLLCKRWLSNWAALGTALLFSSQPLLWGHAFINPKDIPFMAFFLASVVLGLRMLDMALGPADYASETWGQRWRSLQENWKSAKPAAHKSLFFLLFFCLFFGSLAVLAQEKTQIVIAYILNAILRLPADNLIAKLFFAQADHWESVGVENYVHKASLIVQRFELILMMLFGAVLVYRMLNVMVPGIKPFSIHTVTAFLKSSLAVLRLPSVILAGILLGFTVSIRILGPLALVLVFLVAIFRYRNRALPVLAVYSIVALLSSYLSWPYLWADPTGHFAESFQVMSAFPWLGKVLFDGNYFLPGELPFTYLPVLMSLQFTEPVVFLFIAGLIILVWQSFRKKSNPEMLLVVSVWGLVPFLAFIVFRPPMYDNFRQLLFLIPALFVLIGLSLEKISVMIKNPAYFVLLIMVLSAHGWLTTFRLHPYEYIYYNAFIGGPAGAFRRYETDYWMTSFREATNYLNSVAPKDAHILVWGSVDGVRRYARPDLIVDPNKGAQFDPVKGYDFAILSSRGDRDMRVYTDLEYIYLVEKDSVVMAVVKKIR